MENKKLTSFQYIQFRLKNFYSYTFYSLFLTVIFLLLFVLAKTEGWLDTLSLSDSFLWEVPLFSFLLLMIFFVVGDHLFWTVKETYVSGMRLLPYVDKEIISSKGKGTLKFHKSFKWNLPKSYETSHFFISGAPGSGKTQLILPWMQFVRKRGDKTIIYDNKGDFTEKLQSLNGDKLIIVAPWDERGSRWDIGRDLFNAQLIREFANKLIPESEEIIYSRTARMIVSGCGIYLMNKNGRNWDLNQLINVITKPREELYKILNEHAPEAAELIREPTKLSQNILTNVMSGVEPLVDIAKTWAETERSFSIVDLINEDKQFTLVLQGSGIYKKMANGINRTLIATAASIIETLNDSTERRIWFFLDEFPQLGFIEGFTPLLEIGRSKGVCCVIAVQNFNQLDEIYGISTSKSIRSMCKLHIYARISVGESAIDISNSFSNTVWKKTDITVNDQGEVNSVNQIEVSKPTVDISYLTGYLGTKNKYIDMIMTGFDDYIFNIKLPYTRMPTIREKNVFSDWAKPFSKYEEE